jgi:hypothetical protein
MAMDRYEQTAISTLGGLWAAIFTVATLALGIKILRGVVESERLGRPSCRLIEELRHVSFPLTDENRQPYLGAQFIGAFLTLAGCSGVLGFILELIRR